MISHLEKHPCFRSPFTHGLPTPSPGRNASVLYSLAQMPLLPGSPLPFNPCTLVGGKKIYLVFDVLAHISWNAFSHKRRSVCWLLILRYEQSLYILSPLLPQLNRDQSLWSRKSGPTLVLKLKRENGLALAGVLRDGKINCGSCWSAKRRTCIPLPDSTPHPGRGRTSERVKEKAIRLNRKSRAKRTEGTDLGFVGLEAYAIWGGGSFP